MTLPRALSRAAAIPLACAAAFPLSSPAQNVTLPTAYVTVPRFVEDARIQPFGVSVLTAEDIRRSGASTANEALMRLLGVVGRQDLSGGGEYAIDLRGFGSTADANQVIVVDGVRMSEADLGGTRLAGIPIESIERIEVLRGSGAVLYGEGATGGVIVITTKSGAGAKRANGASLHAGAGTYGLRDLRANANVGAGGFMLDAAVQKRDSDGHRDNFRSEIEAGSLGASWSGNGLRLGVQHAQDRLASGLPGSLTAAQYATNPRQATTPADRGTVRSERNGFNAQATWGGWQFAFDAGSRDKEARSNYASYGGSYDYDISASNQSLRARHEAGWAGGRNVFTVGADRSRWTRDVLGTYGTTAHQRNSAWYLKDDYTFAGGTLLSAGWRSERVTKDHTYAVSNIADRLNAWEIGASQPLGGNVTAYARAGRSFRLANADEFSFTAPGAVLRPQISRDIELGARWAGRGTRVEARLFRSMLTDEIGFDPNAAGTFGFGANVNYDPTRRQGLEIEAAHAVTSTLDLRANASVRRSAFRSGPYAGKDVPLAPRHTLAVRADWAPLPNHRIGAGVNWVSSQHPDFANACAMPAYTVVDARYAYSWRNAEFSLGVGNLADRKYYTQAFACAGGATTAIYPEPGRNVTAAVRMAF